MQKIHDSVDTRCVDFHMKLKKTEQKTFEHDVEVAKFESLVEEKEKEVDVMKGKVFFFLFFFFFILYFSIVFIYSFLYIYILFNLPPRTARKRRKRKRKIERNCQQPPTNQQTTRIQIGRTMSPFR